MNIISVDQRPLAVNLPAMIEDDPDELARLEADAEADLPDVAEMLFGLPATIPDLLAAIADLDTRLEHKRAELKACLDRCDDGDIPDFVLELRREIDTLTQRRADYVRQLDQRN